MDFCCFRKATSWLAGARFGRPSFLKPDLVLHGMFKSNSYTNRLTPASLQIAARRNREMGAQILMLPLFELKINIKRVFEVFNQTGARALLADRQPV
jgi:hypothetical protein